jgi:hypothetical protein
MLSQFEDIPTETLFDFVFAIFNLETSLSSREIAELEEIQRELQRRGEIKRWEC